MRPSPELRPDGAGVARVADLDLTDLSVGELLLVWALRMRLARGPCGPVSGFRLAFGLSGVEPALASFEGFYGLLRRSCRGDIAMHAPGCHCISPDEMALAGVVAALQAGAPLHAEAVAAQLVDAAALDGLLEHARDLAASLEAQKLYLPVRLPACGGGRRPLLH